MVVLFGFGIASLLRSALIGVYCLEATSLSPRSFFLRPRLSALQTPTTTLLYHAGSSRPFRMTWLY